MFVRPEPSPLKAVAVTDPTTVMLFWKDAEPAASKLPNETDMLPLVRSVVVGRAERAAGRPLTSPCVMDAQPVPFSQVVELAVPEPSRAAARMPLAPKTGTSPEAVPVLATAAVPSPRLVRAVAAFARSLRLDATFSCASLVTFDRPT